MMMQGESVADRVGNQHGHQSDKYKNECNFVLRKSHWISLRTI